MMNGNTKLAMQSIRSSKWRSFLTMLGIIIGVASVIITVSLGEGVKQQINNQISQFGSDIITIRPGSVSSKQQNSPFGISLFNNVTTVFNDNDVRAVSKVPGIESSAPLGLVSAVPRYEDREFSNGLVIGTTASLPQLMSQKVQYGSFFSVGEEGRRVAVMGPAAAQQLFQENVPIGKSFQLRGEEFIVRGIFEEFESNPITPGADFNNAVFIPYVTGKTLTEGNSQVFQIFAKPEQPEKLEETADAVKQALLRSRDNQEDFTILTQGESLDESSTTLSLITAMIAGVAAISLLVGGIGIMNIMLVSVSERTREIGIRKAIGATNRQIMHQFLIEAVILSLVGSIIGILVSLLANFLIRLTTDLQPAVNLRVAGLAILVALGVGIIFGVAPAIRAARKDPIQALRYQ